MKMLRSRWLTRSEYSLSTSTSSISSASFTLRGGARLELLDHPLQVVAEVAPVVALGARGGSAASARVAGSSSRLSTVSAISAWKKACSGTPWRSMKTGKNVPLAALVGRQHAASGGSRNVVFPMRRSPVIIRLLWWSVLSMRAVSFCAPEEHVVVEDGRARDVGVEAAAHGARRRRSRCVPQPRPTRPEGARRGRGEEVPRLVEAQPPLDAERHSTRESPPVSIAVTDDRVRARLERQLALERHRPRGSPAASSRARTRRPACSPTRNSTFGHAPVVGGDALQRQRGGLDHRVLARLEERERRLLVRQPARDDRLAGAPLGLGQPLAGPRRGPASSCSTPRKPPAPRGSGPRPSAPRPRAASLSISARSSFCSRRPSRICRARISRSRASRVLRVGRGVGERAERGLVLAGVEERLARRAKAFCRAARVVEAQDALLGLRAAPRAPGRSWGRGRAPRRRPPWPRWRLPSSSSRSPSDEALLEALGAGRRVRGLAPAPRAGAPAPRVDRALRVGVEARARAPPPAPAAAATRPRRRVRPSSCAALEQALAPRRARAACRRAASARLRLAAALDEVGEERRLLDGALLLREVEGVDGGRRTPAARAGTRPGSSGAGSRRTAARRSARWSPGAGRSRTASLQVRDAVGAASCSGMSRSRACR